MLRLRGEWPQAEELAQTACEEVQQFDRRAAAGGHYEIGEIRRRRGDGAGAERAYTRAHELGRDPQPGLALLRLAQGRIDAARASIDAALAGFGGSDLERAPLVAARADIALAAEDPDTADEAAAEVVEIGIRFDSAALQAVGRRCQGAVALARGQGVTALPALRSAFTHWNELDVPYEAARTRVLLAQAYEALDDHDAAARECAAARTCFEQLGATADLHALVADTAAPCGLTDREVEVLRLVATGRTNREVAQHLVISEKTVARHLANIFTKVGVGSRSAATAFAYANGLASAADT
jgi:ATP/maltotriose-dependent transcriptional regulator MalT